MTRKIEEFVPIKEGEVTIYACGPTVYDFIHIGNARPMITFDCFRKYLIYLGYKVSYVQNFTDVDDKIISKANNEGVDYKEISKKYISEYKKDAKRLNVSEPTVEPRATESIEDIINIVKRLIDRGFAYEKDGDVYFRTKKYEQYGKLSHMPIEDLMSGKRIMVSNLKENSLDFAVWKKSKENEPYWDSPWGKGRPGWHIECSAMAAKNLGESIDIHCGGRDLIFPHHENEIAQSECAFSKKFANYWMHNGYINIDNKKMSKSKGNFFTVREISEKYGYMPIRFLMLASHYRSPINYSEEVIIQSKSALARIENFINGLNFALENVEQGEIKKEDKKYIDTKKKNFLKSLDNDFNTADAISEVFDIIRKYNQFVTMKEKATFGLIDYLSINLNEMLNIFGLIKVDKEDELDKEVLLLFEKRKKAREEKNFDLADSLRDELDSLGYIVEETRKGSRLIKKT